MNTKRSSCWLLKLVCLSMMFFACGTFAAAASDGKLDNAGCLTCHSPKADKIIVVGTDGGKRTVAAVDHIGYGKGIHGEMQCVTCHKEITDSKASHVKAANIPPPNCVTCHEALWDAVKKGNLTKGKERLGLVAENIAAYKNSFHARPNKEDKSHVNATCNDCHDTHTFLVPPKDTLAYAQWRLATPALCGEKCHTDELDDYKESVHGKETQEKGNLKAAVCVDCHTTHAIGNTSANPIKLTITANCGNCHKENLKTYLSTYHGQVNRLGYAYTAKCFDCHGSHGILKVDDPKSTVHPDNRLKTCQGCHNDKKQGMHTATPGFMTFGPHADTHNFQKYPQMWIAYNFMIGLLIFVFAFFWAHSGLWYYREWQDRKAGKPHAVIDLRGLDIDQTKHFQRFAVGWRIGHLTFALITMTLVLTGTSALYAHSNWAPVVANLLGGPKMLGLIHRVAATLFITIFLIHFVYVMQKLLRSKTFRWFGPDSLIPNWKDFADCWGMFKWFLGKGPRPMFERWAYYEKFDYWAVFWGVNIIGWSGLMLAFPHVTAQYLPGWIFNVGTLIHGEEAFLAAVFLFTVHFFNNHFRPDKLPPPDIVMFTGTQSLREFRHDHPAHFQRLVDTGELAKHLVEAPSKPMTTGSKILGLVLIAVGLTLLVLVLNGFLGGL